MGTLQYILQKKYPLHHILTQEDKTEIIKENQHINFSYKCLIEERLRYKDVTVQDLLRGWGGVRLFKL